MMNDENQWFSSDLQIDLRGQNLGFFPKAIKWLVKILKKLKRKIKSQFGFVSKSLIDPAPQYRKQKFQQFLKKKMPNYL